MKSYISSTGFVSNKCQKPFICRQGINMFYWPSGALSSAWSQLDKQCLWLVNYPLYKQMTNVAERCFFVLCIFVQSSNRCRHSIWTAHDKNSMETFFVPSILSHCNCIQSRYFCQCLKKVMFTNQSTCMGGLTI